MYDRLQDLLLQRDILHADETTLKFSRSFAAATTKLSSSGSTAPGAGPPIIWMSINRHGMARIESVFTAYRYLHVDGYRVSRPAG